jgi:hypothetical protein
MYPHVANENIEHAKFYGRSFYSFTQIKYTVPVSFKIQPKLEVRFSQWRKHVETILRTLPLRLSTSDYSVTGFRLDCPRSVLSWTKDSSPLWNTSESYTPPICDRIQEVGGLRKSGQSVYLTIRRPLPPNSLSSNSTYPTCLQKIVFNHRD